MTHCLTGSEASINIQLKFRMHILYADEAGAKVSVTRSADSPKTLRSCCTAGLSRRFYFFMMKPVIKIQKQADEVYFVIRRKI